MMDRYWLGIPLALTLAVLASQLSLPAAGQKPPPMPYAEAGLTPREAAVHLLLRFSYGHRPGEVDRVLEQGLEAWFEQQLQNQSEPPQLEACLASLAPVHMTARQIYRQFEDGPREQLIEALMTQKLARAVYSRNQLREVMTDFWQNHFHVSLQSETAQVFLLPYERDAIRPRALASFRSLLRATATHPAMLAYLDNNGSRAASNATTSLDLRIRQGVSSEVSRAYEEWNRSRAQRLSGLNENYARELLELHTLGVDGGYSQGDVVEVARVLTGWTVFPEGPAARRLEGLSDLGFVRRGDFLFRADLHDAGAKTILGQRYPPGGGLEEGERLLDALARHPATARHLAQKLAVRFVCDDPPASVVERLAETYQASGGSTEAMLRTLVASPEFWSRQVLRAKVKSPFELIASALRATGAEVRPNRKLLLALRTLGGVPYAYQAPTGYPDRGSFWINPGTLMNRMKLGPALTSGRLEGIDLSWWRQSPLLESLTSRQQALEVCSEVLLPEAQGAADSLKPIVNEAQFGDERLVPRLAALLLSSPDFQLR